MKKEDLKVYLSVGITSFAVIAASIILFFVIYRWKGIIALFRWLFQVLAPFLIGLMIAYLINPLFTALQRSISKLLLRCKITKNEERAQGMSSGISSVLSVLIILSVIVVIFSVIIPEIYRSVSAIVNGFEGNSDNLESNIKMWLIKILGEDSKIEHVLMAYYDKVREIISDWIQGGAFLELLKNSAGPIFGSIYAGISMVVSAVINIFVAIIVVIYLLNSKNMFLAQARKILYGLTGKKCADVVLEEIHFAHEVFGRYIRGALADSFILGCVVFILMNLLGIPYALLVSIMVAMTNVIPFFGPYIGGIPSAFLILLVSPMACLKFVIMILIMQQIEGNIISPKIIGNSTGLSGFWVLFAIMFFGSFLKIFGLLFGVPLFAVLQHIASNWLDRHLKKKHLPTDIAQYAGDGMVELVISPEELAQEAVTIKEQE